MIELYCGMYSIYHLQEFFQFSFATVPYKEDIVYIPDVHGNVLVNPGVDMEGFKPSP